MAVKEAARAAIRVMASPTAVAAPLSRLGRAGLLPDTVWKRLPVQRTFMVPTPGGGSFRYAAVPGDLLGRALHWRGLKGWDTETLTTFARFAADATFVLDIGANTGVFTLLACADNPQVRVVAFEPAPRVFERLRRNVELNGWTDRCALHDAAVSDSPGTASFHVPPGDVPASASLEEDGFRGLAGERVTVPVMTVDQVCAGRDVLDLVKIDVEGFEDRVLIGMRDTLARLRPVLILECLVDGPAAEIDAALVPYDYRVFHLRADGPVAIPGVRPDPAGRFRNFLCAPADRVAALGLG